MLEFPRLTPADDLAVLDSHVCLDDTDGCIDDDHVGDHEVEGTVDAARLRILAHAVAQRLAAAVDRLVSDGSKIFLDLDVQVGIAQPDLVTRGDPEQDLNTLVSKCLSWVLLSFVRRERESVGLRFGQKAEFFGTLDGSGKPRPVGGVGRRPTVDKSVEALHSLLAAERHQRHFLLVARLEPDRRARGNVEAPAEGLFTIEGQRAIDFHEVVVRTHLDGTVTGVSDSQLQNVDGPR